MQLRPDARDISNRDDQTKSKPDRPIKGRERRQKKKIKV
jgi:hypothetical protein